MRASTWSLYPTGYDRRVPSESGLGMSIISRLIGRAAQDRKTVRLRDIALHLHIWMNKSRSVFEFHDIFFDILLYNAITKLRFLYPSSCLMTQTECPSFVILTWMACSYASSVQDLLKAKRTSTCERHFSKAVLLQAPARMIDLQAIQRSCTVLLRE
jgi:hypothetical protein